MTCVPAVSVLYSFSGAPGDGAYPWYTSLLLASDGNLYGMTSAGGAYNGGTVFRITPGGSETVLWSFGNGTDGASPYGSLIEGSDGNFYGMTNLGGLYARGTVFVITPGGVETVLSSFGNIPIPPPTATTRLGPSSKEATVISMGWRTEQVQRTPRVSSRSRLVV